MRYLTEFIKELSKNGRVTILEFSFEGDYICSKEYYFYNRLGNHTLCLKKYNGEIIADEVEIDIKNIYISEKDMLECITEILYLDFCNKENQYKIVPSFNKENVSNDVIKTFITKAYKALSISNHELVLSHGTGNDYLNKYLEEASIKIEDDVNPSIKDIEILEQSFIDRMDYINELYYKLLSTPHDKRAYLDVCDEWIKIYDDRTPALVLNLDK